MELLFVSQAVIATRAATPSVSQTASELYAGILSLRRLYMYRYKLLVHRVEPSSKPVSIIIICLLCHGVTKAPKNMIKICTRLNSTSQRRDEPQQHRWAALGLSFSNCPPRNPHASRQKRREQPTTNASNRPLAPWPG